jgi:hypothetical protein
MNRKEKGIWEDRPDSRKNVDEINGVGLFGCDPVEGETSCRLM